MIAALGFLLALVAAGGFIGVRETLDQTIRKIAQVTEVVGAPPLAAIPYLKLEEDVAANSKRVYIVLGVLATGIMLALLMMHWLWTPLDVLWFRGLRKFDNLLG
ncbi:MAG: hypothetical protein PHE55_11260 [Methylococcaceae bacterium]|nr:hypothetical protein [Methylococcaceae bacterium]